jgi:hypothetical protein
MDGIRQARGDLWRRVALYCVDSGFFGELMYSRILTAKAGIKVGASGQKNRLLMLFSSAFRCAAGVSGWRGYFVENIFINVVIDDLLVAVVAAF